MKRDAWDNFLHSGSVDDYLKYKKRQQQYLNEMGTEVIINDSKRDRNGRNSRRDHSKK